jgi:nucleoside-diphosphate-sugar epimerase
LPDEGDEMDFLGTIIDPSERVLVTGAAGFIGTRLVERLLAHGFRNLRCLVRVSSNLGRLLAVREGWSHAAQVEIIEGNLLSREVCQAAAKDVAVIYHLAAGTGTDSFPDAFINSVVTTRNLLEASLQHRCLKRFVSLSSFAVYTNRNKAGAVLDEGCPIEESPASRGDAYCYAKMKQDELLAEYGKRRGIPYVILRPGVVYGAGKKGLPGRIGLGTFGVFLHLGGSNRVPLTYVDNCCDAIVLGGLKQGIDGEVFNVVDNDLPSSRQLLRMFKRNVKPFKSVYLPHWISYLCFYAWEKYSTWSQGQLPPVFNRKAWHAYWKGSAYSNEKLKRILGWSQRISTSDGLNRFLESCRETGHHA